MRLNHPQTTPPAMEKLSSMKLVPGAKDVGDLCSRRFRTWEDGKQVVTFFMTFQKNGVS